MEEEKKTQEKDDGRTSEFRVRNRRMPRRNHHRPDRQRTPGWNCQMLMDWHEKGPERFFCLRLILRDRIARVNAEFSQIPESERENAEASGKQGFSRTQLQSMKKVLVE